MSDTGHREAREVMVLLGKIAQMSTRPEVQPRRKLRKCGLFAYRIQQLLLKGALKKIREDEGFAPENG